MANLPVVFLSHSGLDHKLANDLAQRLELGLNVRGLSVRVFNTSEPENRFKDIREVIEVGANFAVETEKYEAELRAYLKGNLLSSAAYVLLVTKQSLRKNSGWIEFEMELARAPAKKKCQFFFPCAADGATLSQLPRVASYFQGIQLDAHDGFRKLSGAVELVINSKLQDEGT